MNTIEIIGLFVAVISVFIAIWAQTKILRWTFFAEYTKRYQKIMFHLPENMDDIDGLKNKETRRYLRIYFDLCDEQYFLYRKGRLNRRIWKNWKEGMESMFSTKIVSTYWKENRTDSSKFNDFVEKDIIGNSQ